MARKLIDETEMTISMPFTTPCFEALFAVSSMLLDTKA